MVAKENYPWLNLMELNDSNKIWEKYNITNAAGGRFLVNQQGTILAINPTIEKLENRLEELL